VRPVGGLGSRMAAAAAAGIGTVFAPTGSSGSSGLRVVQVRRVLEAAAWASRTTPRSGSRVDDSAA